VDNCVDSSVLSAPASGSGVTSAVPPDVSASDYLERLKVLRARCGLDNDVNTLTDSSSSDVTVAVTKSRVTTLHVPDANIAAVST